MAKPPLPTQQEMRDYCRTHYGHWSNLSRYWLAQQTSAAERTSTYGYADIDRDMAEVWETEFFTKTTIEQDTLLDWYIAYYGQRYDQKGKRRINKDPNGDGPLYALGGYIIGQLRHTPICNCKFFAMSSVPGGYSDTWLATLKQGPEHTAIGQALFDAVNGEGERYSAVMKIIETLISAETKDDRTTLSFTASRLGGTDERVLEVTISDTTKPQRDLVADAIDAMFGSGAVVVR